MGSGRVEAATGDYLTVNLAGWAVVSALGALLPAKLVGEVERRIDLCLSTQRGADGEEVGGRGDVMDAQHVCAGIHPARDRRERAREPRPRRSPGDRPDEVLA